MKSWFAITSVLGAIAMLGLGFYYIVKNTPQDKDATVDRLPPTAPVYELAGEVATPGAASGTRNPAALHNVERVQFIGGVGIIEPVGEATVIGSQLAGIVEEICVRPGDQVKAGAPLLKLDQRSAAANVAVATAELAAQQAKLQELMAQTKVQQAKFEAALSLAEQSKVTLANTKKELDRATALQGTFALSEEELDSRILALEIAKSKTAEADANVAQAKANLELLTGSSHPATIEVQKAAIQQAQANLERATTELQLRTIVAPTDGTILGVRIRVGEFVPAAVVSSPFITMGVIDPLHVRVEIDESEISRFEPVSKAFASLRGQPEKKVPLEFVRQEPIVSPKKSLTGTVSERVDTRVLQIIYSADPEQLNASVGQQVDVYIEAKSSAQTKAH